MLALLAQVYRTAPHYGFFGIEGVFGILIGLVIFLIVAAVIWKICALLMANFGVAPVWIQIIQLVFTLIILLAFLHFFGLY
jgi:hypothetical protein